MAKERGMSVQSSKVSISGESTAKIARHRIALALLLAALVTTACGAGREVGEVDPFFMPTGMVCGQDSALILGARFDEVGDLQPGDPDLLNTSPYAYRATTDEAKLQSVPIGPIAGLTEGSRASPTDWSSPQHGLVYVVVTASVASNSEEGFLVRSTDGGESWSTIETAPEGIIGVEFESRDSGFVWSDVMIYRTDDGGRSWIGAESPARIHRGRPRPVVTTDGSLWMALGYLSVESATNHLIRVMPDLTIDSRLNTPFEVGAMDASEDDLWLLAAVEQHDRIDLMRITAGDKQLRVVHSMPSGLPTYVAVKGSEVVILMSDRGSGADSLYVSADGGQSLSRKRPAERLITSICSLGIENAWFMGSSGTIYAPD